MKRDKALGSETGASQGGARRNPRDEASESQLEDFAEKPTEADGRYIKHGRTTRTGSQRRARRGY